MGGFEIVLILAFILISVLDGMARSRKRKMGGAPPRGSASPTRRPVRRAPQPPRTGTEPETSEGLIPADVWEELAGLIRGEPQVASRRLPEPPQEVSLPGEAQGTMGGPVHPSAEETEVEVVGWGDSPELPSWTEERSPWAAGGAPFEDAARGPAPVPVPQASPPPRTAPALERLEAAPSLRGPRGVVGERARQEDRGPAAYGAEGERPPARRLRLSLAGGSPRRLREAVVLREVLGPPISLRESDDESAR